MRLHKWSQGASFSKLICSRVQIFLSIEAIPVIILILYSPLFRKFIYFKIISILDRILQPVLSQVKWCPPHVNQSGIGLLPNLTCRNNIAKKIKKIDRVSYLITHLSIRQMELLFRLSNSLHQVDMMFLGNDKSYNNRKSILAKAAVFDSSRLVFYNSHHLSQQDGTVTSSDGTTFKLIHLRNIILPHASRYLLYKCYISLMLMI